MSDDETIYGDPDRTEPAKRQFKNWPLPDVDLDTLITEDDFGEGTKWPPQRVAPRVTRYNTYAALWRGDVSQFVDDETSCRIVINMFRRALKIVGTLLTTSGPVEELLTAAATSAIHALQFGRAYGVYIDGRYFSPRNTVCFPGVDGELFLVDFFTSPTAPTEKQDRMRVRRIVNAGESSETHYGWTGGNLIGEVVDELEIVDGAWSMRENSPTPEGHGESFLDDLIPPIVAQGLRLTGNEAPTKVIPVATADLMRAITGDNSVTGTPSQYGRQAAQDALTRMTGHDAVWAPSGTKPGYVLEWTGNLDAGQMIIEFYEEMLRVLTGLPTAMLTEGGNIASGASLREQHLILWAETRQLHIELNAMWTELYGADTQWPNPFDVPIGAAPEPDPEPPDA